MVNSKFSFVLHVQDFEIHGLPAKELERLIDWNEYRPCAVYCKPMFERPEYCKYCTGSRDDFAGAVRTVLAYYELQKPRPRSIRASTAHADHMYSIL